MALIEEAKLKKRPISSVAVLDERNRITIKEKKKKKPKVLSSFGDITPIVDIAEYDFLELRNEEYMEIVQVTSKDIYGMNESDKDNDIFSLAYLFQAYMPDMKLVPLHTPINLDVQKDNVRKNIQRCKEPAYLPFLEKKLAELEFIEENRTNKEYFFFLYADSVKQLLERKGQFKRLFARSNPVTEIPLEKKLNVLYQLFNLNSKPKID